MKKNLTNADMQLFDQAEKYMFTGDPENNKKAASLLEKPAEHGHMGAQYFLGEYYDPGLQHGGNNGKKACYWYTKAAKQGHVEAQNNLGCLLVNGIYVSKNGTKAKYWLKKAVKQGNEVAERNFDKGGFEDTKGTILSIIGAIVFAAIVFSIMSYLFDFYSAPVHIGGAVVGWIIVREMRKRL